MSQDQTWLGGLRQKLRLLVDRMAELIPPFPNLAMVGQQAVHGSDGAMIDGFVEQGGDHHLADPQRHAAAPLTQAMLTASGEARLRREPMQPGLVRLPIRHLEPHLQDVASPVGLVFVRHAENDQLHGRMRRRPSTGLRATRKPALRRLRAPTPCIASVARDGCRVSGGSGAALVNRPPPFATPEASPAQPPEGNSASQPDGAPPLPFERAKPRRRPNVGARRSIPRDWRPESR